MRAFDSRFGFKISLATAVVVSEIRCWLKACVASSVGLIIVPVASGGQSIPIQSISGATTCQNCEVVLQRVALVTDRGDSNSVTVHRAPVVDGRGRLYFLSEGGMNGIIVFDSSGRFLARVGRLGQGPGEFGGAGTQFFVARGDTLVVCGARICQLFSSEHRYVRSISTIPGSVTYGAAVFSDGTFALQMRSSDSLYFRNPVHVFSTVGRLVRSFGAAESLARDCTLCAANSAIGSSFARDGLWVSQPGRHELLFWDSRGNLSRRIRYTGANWFTQWQVSSRGAVPMSRITAMIEDANGVLFVLGVQAEQGGGRAVLPANAKVNSTEAGRPIGQVRRTPIIEAIDTRTGTVIARKLFPTLNVSTFGGPYVTTVRSLDSLVQQVEVWRVALRRN